MPSDSILLTNVSESQIDKILFRLNLVAPSTYDLDGRILLLRSSVIFVNKLGDYEDDDIQVHFKKGNFVDFSTTDGVIDGIIGGMVTMVFIDELVNKA